MSMNPQINVSENLCDPEWDEFVAAAPGGHHVQSALWGQVKAVNHWEVIRITAREGGTLVGGAQLLRRTIARTPASVIYLTKGPLVTRGDSEVARQILQQASLVCKKKHAVIFAIQPPNNGDWISACLPSWGFAPSKLELAPVASTLLDLVPSLDEIMGRMKRQTRQNIRRGEQAGVTVRDGRENDIDLFYELHTTTSTRQGFSPYAKRYFTHMQEVLKPKGYFKLFVAEYGGQPVSSLLTVPFGDTVIAKILGCSGEHSGLRPNDCLFWNAIQWSKTNGYRYFDFEGIDLQNARAILTGETLPAHFQHTPDFFKLGYGGEVVIFPQAYESVPNPFVNWIYKKASPTVGGDSMASSIMDRLRKI